jgi:ketosteroid isomerase-like protein
MEGLRSFDTDDVDAFIRDWKRWFDSGDYKTMGAFYAEDARLVATRAPTVRGRAAITEFWRVACGGGRAMQLRRTIQLEQAECDGGLGYMRGTVTLGGPAMSEPVTVRYATLWKRQGDGLWRLIEDISSPGPG